MKENSEVAKVAIALGYLEERAARKAYEMASEADRGLLSVLREERLLSESQALKVENVIRYRRQRREDKVYAADAVRARVLDAESARLALARQKRKFETRGRVVPLPLMLRAEGFLTAEQDQRVRQFRFRAAGSTLTDVEGEAPALRRDSAEIMEQAMRQRARERAKRVHRGPGKPPSDGGHSLLAALLAILGWAAAF